MTRRRDLRSLVGGVCLLLGHWLRDVLLIAAAIKVLFYL